MFAFHLTVHAHPPGSIPRQVQTWRDQDIECLDIPSNALTIPIPMTFEQASDNLEKLPGMLIELDGSFVWSIHEPSGGQVDGHLYDRHGQLIYVLLRGACTWQRFQQLVGCLGDSIPFVYQLLQAGLIVDHTELQRLAFLSWPEA